MAVIVGGLIGYGLYRIVETWENSSVRVRMLARKKQKRRDQVAKEKLRLSKHTQKLEFDSSSWS